MIATFLPYVKCLVPVAAGVLLFFGYLFTQRMIGAWLISRPIPMGGFQSIEEEIRYVNDDPAIMRRHWRYRSWFIILGVASLCMPLSIILPNLVIKMVAK